MHAVSNMSSSIPQNVSIHMSYSNPRNVLSFPPAIKAHQHLFSDGVQTLAPEMVNIPVKFRRVAAAFDKAAMAVTCDDSSGSDHSAAAAADLSDLVNSFLERGIGEERTGEDEDDMDDHESDPSNDRDQEGFEVHNSLKRLFDREDRTLHAAVEKAMGELSGDRSSLPDFKRRLMTWLRTNGFDAGVCKSRWDKTGSQPSGDYEYVDVNATGGIRYIVEVSLAAQFTIARPTSSYGALVDAFPAVFVGEAVVLKQVVMIMCKAMKKSMKSAGLKVPPWRRRGYMQSKWFGPYKRTTNDTPTGKEDAGGRRPLTVGFAPVKVVHCHEAYGGVRVGNLN